MKPIIREATWMDRTQLIDIDIKCFDDVWPSEDWVHWMKEDRVVFISEIYSPTPGVFPQLVGFVACILLSDGIAIEKIGVKPNHRRQGVAADLLYEINHKAESREWPHVVTLTVPETFLSPGCPDDISGWIIKSGFKAKTPLQPDYFYINGDSIDGVPCLFEN
jgi:ribosomal protein S18 acetylase RimI-like enzyme